MHKQSHEGGKLRPSIILNVHESEEEKSSLKIGNIYSGKEEYVLTLNPFVLIGKARNFWVAGFQI